MPKEEYLELTLHFLEFINISSIVFPIFGL